MRSVCLKLISMAATLCIGGNALAQSLVGNPGFEVDTLGEAAPSAGNWASFFGGPAILAADRSSTAPRTGTSALHLQITGPSNAFVGVQQPIPGVQPGVSYTMKIWARRAGNINNAVEYRFEWQNSGGAAIGDQFALTTRIDSTLTNTYQQYTLTAVAPVGAARANLVLDLQSFPGAFDPLNPMFDTEVFIDDVEFAATPLPTQNACCFPADGTCQVALTGACPSGSVAQAAGSICAPNNCPPPISPGACCNNSTGSCTLVLGAICTPIGGNFRGDGTSCTPNPCTVTPVCRADFNNSGLVSVQDIFDFLTAYFTGCP